MPDSGVSVFYNPFMVGRLAASGITAHRQPPPSGRPAAGFVVDTRRQAPRARETITNVISRNGHVTITGPRQTVQRTQLLLPARTEPQTALDLAEENMRLRRENQRQADEIARLRTEVAQLRGVSPPSPRETDLDDASRRFSLLELDL